MKRIFYACLFLSVQGFAQEENPGNVFDLLGHREGQLYVTWGYNRAFYDKSDIRFKGDDFDFTLYGVDAKDMPEEFNPKVYFNPATLSVPQFNFRMGYYFRKNTALSLGWDHMKYHVIPTQRVRISGYIDEIYSEGDPLTGQLPDQYILYTPKFMDYHHSDGFNFIRLGLDQRLPVWRSKNGKHFFVLHGAVNMGAMLPWTDWTFFRNHYRNKLHLAGYGASVSMGARIELFRYFFIQGNLQVGKVNMPDIVLQDHLSSRASQKITFYERSWAFGAYIPIVKKEKK